MSVSIRPATADDFAVLGETLPHRSRAWAAEKDGRLLGLGGVMMQPDGIVHAWVHLLPGAEKYPLTLHKTALRFLDEQSNRGVRQIVAIAQDEIEASARWLQRLGFEHANVEGLRAYIWRTP